MARPPPGQDPSNITYSEYPSAPAPQETSFYPLKTDQRNLDVVVEESFDSQDVDLHVNIPSDMGASLDHRIFAPHPADMQQEMGWTGNYRDTRTVDPKDLLLQEPL
jgi:hypothetical protein